MNMPMVKQGDRVQLIDQWKLPAVGSFPEERIPCGATGVVSAVQPHPIDAARPPYAWVVFNEYYPPVGPGNPFQIPANFLQKPDEPATVALQRCNRALRDAALNVVVMHGATPAERASNPFIIIAFIDRAPASPDKLVQG